MLYTAGWLLTRWIVASYFRRRESGSQHIPAEGPFILASNHASLMDPPLVGSACPRPISYLARESLFKNPLGGWILRSVGCVPVDRDGATGRGLRTILQRLLEGDGIILFPEGTRTSDGSLQAGRAGIGLVVLRSKAPVVPARVFGTFEAFGRHHRLPRPKAVGVTIGPALRFERIREEAVNASRARMKELYQEVSNEIMAAIARLERP
jgi:1-acyl-sn-glycerol-3-phosphate acyltransferase